MSSKVGKDLVAELLFSKREYRIIIHSGSTKNFPGTMLLGPTDVDVQCMTDTGYQYFPMEAILGHELGHLVGSYYGKDQEQADVDNVENPIRRGLGYPLRKDYFDTRSGPGFRNPNHAARWPWAPPLFFRGF